MTRVRVIVAWVAFAGAGLCLLGAATLLAELQDGSDPPPPKLTRRAGSTKHAWRSGPATTPPQTEVVPPPPEAPPPAKSPLLPGQAEGKKPAVTKPSDIAPAASGLLPRHPSASANETASTANAVLRDDSNASNPESQRIRVELYRLRDNAGARRAFYEELRRTVEQVRAGQQNEGSQKPDSPLPAAPQSPNNSGKNPIPPAMNKPHELPPAKPGDLQVFLGAVGARNDTVAEDETSATGLQLV